MRLPIPVHVVTIATGIAIVLAAAYDGADGAAKYRTRDCARPGADARKHGARESAGTGAVLKGLTSDIVAEGADTVTFKLTGPTGIIPGLLTLTPAVIQSNSRSTWPPSKSVTAGPPPLYGMWTICMPVMSLN